MSNDLERIEPTDTKHEIIIMRPIESSHHKKSLNNTWSPWAVFGVLVAAIVVGNIIWWWGASVYAQHELGVALEKDRLEQQSLEQKNKIENEQFYRDMNRRTIENQQVQERVNIENSRDAWENYYKAQQLEAENLKRQANQNQQVEWKNISNGQNLKYDTHSQTPEEAKAETCKSWVNSNIVDPSPDKSQFIRANCG